MGENEFKIDRAELAKQVIGAAFMNGILPSVIKDERKVELFQSVLKVFLKHGIDVMTALDILNELSEKIQ